MPAARMGKKLKRGAEMARMAKGGQMGGDVSASVMPDAGAGGPMGARGAVMKRAAGMAGREAMPSDMAGGRRGEQMAAEMALAERAARMPRAAAGQPEMAPNMQGPATAPPEPAAAPIPAGGPDMGPTPKGVMDAGAGAGGRLTRPGTGLIRPAAAGPGIRPIAGGEAVPAPMPVQAQAAPMAKMLAQRQPMSGFQPRKRKQQRPGRFFTGGGAGGMM